MRFEGKRVLITGGAGFLGSHVAEQLVAEGASVVLVDDFSTGRRENIAALLAGDHATLIEGNCNDVATIDRCFAHGTYDYVIHYAALLGVKAIIERPLDVYRDLDGMRLFFDRCEKEKVGKILYASSSEVYGEPVELPEREDGAINVHTKDAYGIVKLAGEQLLRVYADRGMSTLSMRFFNVYGPRQVSSAYGFVVGIFITQALMGKPLTVFGDGSQTRDFVYVTDQVEAVLRLALSSIGDGRAVNIGSGIRTSIATLAQQVQAVAGSDAAIQTLPYRSVEILHRQAATTQLATITGFVPTTSVRDGLEKTIAWYREKLS